MNTYKVKEEDLIGDIEGFPIEVVQKMVEKQVEQGNEADVTVFQIWKNTASYKGGFCWDDTEDGRWFWSEVIEDRNFEKFFEKYPHQTVEEGIKQSEGKLPLELDWSFIRQMAERMQSNKSNGKYPPYNWQKKMDVQQLKDACMRHMLSVMGGDYQDDGREFGHLEAVATNIMMINYQLKHYKND